jgi:hypothetical protein
MTQGENIAANGGFKQVDAKGKIYMKIGHEIFLKTL